jgi:hypothetical protein
MTSGQRVLLATAIVAVDVVAVVVPLAAIVLAYVILARPPWFRDWVMRLYEGPGARR